MNLIGILQVLIEDGERFVLHGNARPDGYNVSLQADYVAWRLQAISTLSEMSEATAPMLSDLEADKAGPYCYKASAQRVMGCLKGALAIAERQAKAAIRPETEEGRPVAVSSSSLGVFIVHGHDETLLQQTARFLEKLGADPIILFERPGKGQTIIEKLEQNSDVRFAVVLLTPDDAGKDTKTEGLPKPRARQNVILELGYFLGKLGRSNVVALYDESVELPSDYRGVEYIGVDSAGAWKLKLARELKAAGLPVDMNKAI